MGANLFYGRQFYAELRIINARIACAKCAERVIPLIFLRAIRDAFYFPTCDETQDDIRAERARERTTPLKPQTSALSIAN